jgi:hypothetical protein
MKMRIAFGAISVVLVSGCAIDPLSVSAKASLSTGSVCTPLAIQDPLGVQVRSPDTLDRLNPQAESATARKLLQTHVDNLTVALKASSDVPDALKSDKVIRSMRQLIAYQHLSALRTLVMSARNSKDLILTDKDASALLASLDSAMAGTRPASVSSGDFKRFFKSVVSLKSSDAPSRVVRYESYYFNGAFVDRFGSLLSKPTLSLTITDQEVSGAINALIEALADDLFSETPVWTDNVSSPTKYYPGASSHAPSFLAYENDINSGGHLVALAKSGCGMTELKSEVLGYLAGKAGTWASGESGVILGFVGGANVGLPVVLGKLSIGDNKLVLTIAQTVLSTTAKRAAFEAVIPVLLSIKQQDNAKFAEVLAQLFFGGQS